MSEAPDPIAVLLAPLFGAYSWGSRRVHGSILSLNFGEPTLTVREPTQSVVHLEGAPERMLHRNVFVRGEWYLVIELCVWTVVCEGIELATSSSEQLQIERAVRVLDGQALRDVEIKPDGQSIFRFDLGGVLGIWPADVGLYDQGNEAILWWLLGPTEVLTLRADGHYSIDPRDAGRDTYTWDPIAGRPDR
jgi:hypothetical protein